MANPLTTIFTPPSDCFATLPSTWTKCDYYNSETTNVPSCYWSIPNSCFPTGGSSIWEDLLLQDEGDTVLNIINFTPGVLPTGFYYHPSTALNNDSSSTGTVTSLAGCLSYWNTYGYNYCTADIYAPYDGVNHTTGPITAVMPVIQVQWQSSDLDLFSPASAPLYQSPAPFTVDVTLTESSTPSTSTSESTSTPASTSATSATQVQSAIPTQATVNAHTLSTGAKAGIGVGVGLFALAFFWFGALWYFRKRRNRIGERREMGTPYVETKPELDGRGTVNQSKHAVELSEGGVQEVDGNRITSSSIPVAGEPRFNATARVEMDGGFYGHEAGDRGAPSTTRGKASQ